MKRERAALLMKEALDLASALAEIAELKDARAKRINEKTGPMCLERMGRRLKTMLSITGLGPLLQTITDTGNTKMGSMLLSLAFGAQVQVVKSDQLPPELRKMVRGKKSGFEEDDVSPDDA